MIKNDNFRGFCEKKKIECLGTGGTPGGSPGWGVAMPKYVIFWKRRKKYTSYGIELKDEWLGTEYDLESAKSLVENHLLETQEKLNEFINQSKEVYKPVRVEA